MSDPSNPTPAGSATDGAGGFTALANPFGVATFTAGGAPYAIVASYLDHGVQLIRLAA